MNKYDEDITRALRWMNNQAPNITSLIDQKQEWYNQQHHNFWDQWSKDVFDINTANPFGLSIWCNILGVPTRLFNFESRDKAFAFGKERENFKSSNPGAVIENLLPWSTCSAAAGYVAGGAVATVQYVAGEDGEIDAALVTFGTSGGMISPSAKIDPNKPYNVSFTAKNDTSDSVTINLSLGYNNSTLVTKSIVIPANTGWTRYNADFTTQTTLTDRIIRFYCSTVGAKITVGKFQVNNGTGTKPYTATSGSVLDTATGATGGNFAGAGAGLTDIDDVRRMLKLRYATLVSNGRISYINRMLNWIFNDGKPWNINNKEYAYLADKSCSGFSLEPTIFRADWQGTFEIQQNVARENYMSMNKILQGNSDVQLGPNCVWGSQLLSPDGAVNADTYLIGTVPGQKYIDLHSNTLDGNSPNMAASFFVRRAGTGYSSVIRVDSFEIINGVEVLAASHTFSLLTFAVTGSGYASIRNMGLPSPRNDWCRVGICFPRSLGSTGIKHRIYMCSNAGDILTGGDSGTGYSIWGQQLEPTYRPGDFIPSNIYGITKLAPVVVDKSTGKFTLPIPPASGATLTWSGPWKFGVAARDAIGTGDGAKTQFTIPTPLNNGTPVTKDYYNEIRIGKNVKLSASFIALLNDRNNGLFPQNTGISYLIVKES